MRSLLAVIGVSFVSSLFIGSGLTALGTDRTITVVVQIVGGFTLGILAGLLFEND